MSDTTPLRSIENQSAGNLACFHGWLNGLHRTRGTGHRWRKELPWLEAGIVNVYGRLYITKETIAEFERRALAGELAKDIKPDQTGGSNER
jgi:hypothetical protein